MKVETRRMSAITLMVLIVLSIGIAYAVPQPSHQFYGEVNIVEEPAPYGTLIEAKIDGITYEEGITEDGKYGYNTEDLFKVPADDPETDEVEGGVDGDTVMFYVGGVWAANHTFQSGTIKELHLSIGAPPKQPPVADAGGPYSGKRGRSITFDGTGSHDPNGTIVSYAWDFGDGESGTGVKPGHAYDEVGTYTVTLTVTDDDNATDSDTAEVKVSKPTAPAPSPAPTNKKPVADAGPDQTVYVNRTVHFSGASSRDPDGRIVSYAWDFGDGATASDVEASHEYSESGEYTVTLTVKDNKGKQDTDTCNVTVVGIPAPPVGEATELVPAGETGHVVNASAEADTTLTLNTTSRVTVTVLRFEDNPHPEEMPEASVPKYIDVLVSNPDAVEWPIYVEITYTDDEVEGINETSLGIYYWKDGAWHRYNETGVDIEGNLVWAHMTREELSGRPILIGGMHAIVTPPLPPLLSDLTITPAEIELGDDVTIGFIIENIDDQSFDYIVKMQVGDLTLLIDVELDAYESTSVSKTLTPEAVGQYDVLVDGLTGSFEVKAPPPPPKPAEFLISDLVVNPYETEPGENIVVSAKITNIGEEYGSHTVELKLDGAVVDSDVVDLNGGDSETVTFRTSSEVEGRHTVEVDGSSDSFTVKALPPPKKPIGTWIAIAVIVAITIFLIRRSMLEASPRAEKVNS